MAVGTGMNPRLPSGDQRLAPLRGERHAPQLPRLPAGDVPTCRRADVGEKFRLGVPVLFLLIVLIVL